MPYCTNCGEEVSDEQRYCSYCGERLDEDPRGGADHRGSGGRGTEVSGGRQEGSGRSVPGHESSRSGRSGTRQNAANSHDGFEGDPPPEGYEDPPAVRESRSTSPGAIELFSTAFRSIFGLPAVLLGLFVAWYIASILTIVPAELGLAGLLTSGVLGLFVAGVAYVYAEGEREGKTVALGDAVGRVGGQFFSLFIVWVLFIPVFLIGLSLLILPGLYIGGRLLLAFPACVLDDESPFESLSTSWDLTRQVSLTSMGLLGIALVAFLALALLFSIPQSIAFSVIGVELAEVETLDEALALVEEPRVAAVNAFFQAVALAIPVGAVQVAAARLYLHERYGGSEPSDEPY